uniref:Uncharacterized protein n=1 Tax=Oryza punctata TaxID=4537 RepID=A0A0E0KH45_ORYPU
MVLSPCFRVVNMVSKSTDHGSYGMLTTISIVKELVDHGSYPRGLQQNTNGTITVEAHGGVEERRYVDTHYANIVLDTFVS